mmetsp:Transcript_8853/g.29575  ORF Transcript_8853/g.29575 Transcript_8853/m.29575 type:complete len:432 (-) Transcript_8853:1433-2728(-)
MNSSVFCLAPSLCSNLDCLLHASHACSSMTRKERKPLRKRAQRSRTRLLHVTLDELVPVYSEPDGGKLRSGRTVTQLLHDLVSYTKSLMSPVKHVKKEPRTTREPEAALRNETIRRGMLSCRTESMLVFDRSTLRVEDANDGMLRFLGKLPFKGPQGYSLLHLIHPMEQGRITALLRMLDHQDGRFWMETEILRFSGNGGFCGSRCSLFCSAADSKRGFIFIEPCTSLCLPRSPPLGGGSRRGGDFERCFQFEEICSSSCPLEICSLLSSSLGSTCVGWYGTIAHFLSLHQKSDLVDQLLHEMKIIRRSGVVLRMIQLWCRVTHRSSSEISLQIYFRLKLPVLFGSHATDWQLALDINFSNNFAMVADGSSGSFTAWELDFDCCDDEFRILELKLKENGNRLECCHSRFLYLSPDEFHYSGYIPSSQVRPL